MTMPIVFDVCPKDLQAAAKRAYEAYTANSGGLAWDGRPCPTWDELRAKESPVCSHWCAAVLAVKR